MTKEYYEILEISEKATQEEIKKAYRKLALKWHPDKNSHNQEAAKKKFQEINKAYGILSNEEFKKRYDAGETNFTAGHGSEQEKAFWEENEEKLAEEIRIMEELIRTEAERQEILEKIWLLNAKYLERADISSDINSAFDSSWPIVSVEDLDSKYHKLWEPYQSWLEMVWTIPLNLRRKEKEHSEELKTLKEGMIKAIKEAEVKRQAEEKDKEKQKKQRAGSKIEREITGAIKEIERLMTEKELQTQDLGEYSDYKEKIRELDKIWKIRDLRDRIIKNVSNQRVKGCGNDNKSGEKGGKNRPTNQNNQDGKETEGQIPDESGDNNQKTNYGNLTREELINTINQKDLKISSLSEIITALERKIEELEEEIKELRDEKPQTSQIQHEISKRQTQLSEARNSLAKINALNTEKPTGNNNNFPTGWVIGGGALLIAGIVSLLITKKQKKHK